MFDTGDAGVEGLSRPTSRSRKSADKREAIMQAATRIINAKSYALATMTEIAASLGLRDGTLYYYFPSKQALVYACHVRSMDRFEGFLIAADREAELGAEKLEHFLRHLLEDDQRHGPLLYFGDYFHLASAQRRTIAARAVELTKMLETFLTKGIEDRSIVPCETQIVVQLLLGMLIWLAKWTGSIEGLTVDRLMGAIDAFSLQGLERTGHRATE